MIEVPIISSAEYPKIFAAPLFQVVTILFRSLLIMASSEDSTIAARRDKVISAALRSVTSASCSVLSIAFKGKFGLADSNVFLLKTEQKSWIERHCAYFKVIDI